ncbi:MAG: hypothetical protein ACOYXO_16805, partial [Chloroflexota bacterium]
MENEKIPVPEVTPPNEAEESTPSGETLREETQPQPEAVEEAALSTDKKPTPVWLRKSLTWTAIVLVSLLVGFGLAYFLLYLPAEQARIEASQQVLLLNEQIATLEADLNQAREQLQKTQDELEQTAGELRVLQYSAALTALQHNVTYARLALVTKDLLTARQELSSANTNLKKLIPMIGDKDIETALTERLAAVRSSMTSDPEKSLEELR